MQYVGDDKLPKAIIEIQSYNIFYCLTEMRTKSTPLLLNDQEN